MPEVSKTVAELADIVGGTVEGDGRRAIIGIRGLAGARAEHLSFLSNPKYARQAETTRAGALVVDRRFAGRTAATLIRVDSADAAFARIAALFAPPPVRDAEGAHQSAVVADDVLLGEGASIGAQAVVEQGARVGPRSVVRAGSYVGRGVRIGCDCLIYPNVTLREGTVIGDRVTIHSGTVVGSDGFGYTILDGRQVKIPQLGGVLISDEVEIGANVTIDRARFDQTVLGRGVKIDNLVQIAHNVQIGENSVIVSLCAIAGSTTLGSNCALGGQVAIDGHLTVGDNVMIGAKSGVTKDVPSNSVISGFPAQDHKHDLRLTAELRKLIGASKRFDEIERRLSQLAADT